MPARRKLQLKERAARMAETRQRIARATYELHATVGPLQTTISAIAARAGVQRLTVYHHFPEERELHQACVQYALTLDPPPDPAAWRQVSDPATRLRQGLTELYAYFRRHEALLVNISRDVPLLLPRFGGNVPEALAGFLALPNQLRDALAQGWLADATPALLLATLGLAVDFQTWHTLVRQQRLDEAEMLELMLRVVGWVAVSPTPQGAPCSRTAISTRG